MRHAILIMCFALMWGCKPRADSPIIESPTIAPYVTPEPPIRRAIPVNFPEKKEAPVPTPIPQIAPEPTPVPVIVVKNEPEPTPVPVIVEPTPQPKPPTKEEKKSEESFVISRSDVPVLTPEGLGLIIEYEVGGEAQYRKWPHPEYSGGASGVTWGIGYDAHQNKKTVIFSDWKRIGERPAQRLADTQPYYGASAKVHVKDVIDITVPWEPSIQVFLEVDVSRTDTQCRRAFPGFDELRPKAKDAIRSLVFNRGVSMIGPNRTEMRWMRDIGVPQKDYKGLAQATLKMKRIWRGTDIEAGMYRRRNAEARLFEAL